MIKPCLYLFSLQDSSSLKEDLHSGEWHPPVCDIGNFIERRMISWPKESLTSSTIHKGLELLCRKMVTTGLFIILLSMLPVSNPSMTAARFLLTPNRSQKLLLPQMSHLSNLYYHKVGILPKVEGRLWLPTIKVKAKTVANWQDQISRLDNVKKNSQGRIIRRKEITQTIASEHHRETNSQSVSGWWREPISIATPKREALCAKNF